MGEPVDPDVDVGLAVSRGEDVLVNVYSGYTTLNPGEPTGEQSMVGVLLCPLLEEEFGTDRKSVV